MHITITGENLRVAEIENPELSGEELRKAGLRWLSEKAKAQKRERGKFACDDARRLDHKPRKRTRRVFECSSVRVFEL